MFFCYSGTPVTGCFTLRRPSVVHPSAKNPATSTIVVKSGVEYANAYESMRRVLDAAYLRKIRSYDRVVIKINLCAARPPETGAITHPLFLDSVLRLLRESMDSIDVYVVESDSRVAQPDLSIKWFGFLPVLERWKASYLNLSRAEVVTKKIHGRYLGEVRVPKIMEDAFFITLPKLKTNLGTGITCCLKNQFGCLPEIEKDKYHSHIDDVIVDVNLAMKPDLCIVDAITAMGGELGPGLGTPIPLRTVVYGEDPVAVDAFCAKLMGFNPWLIGHIRKASQTGVGTLHYVTIGNDILAVDPETSKLKMALFRLGSWLNARNSPAYYPDRST